MTEPTQKPVVHKEAGVAGEPCELNGSTVDQIASAFQDGFTNGNMSWEETPEYHKDMYREGVRSAMSALSSAPVPPVDGKVEPVKVKPLVWVDTLHDDHPGGATSKAETPFGEYAITSWSTGEWRTMYGPARGWEGRGTKEELQAAAQADFEQRILSALASAPARHSDEEVERLREIDDWLNAIQNKAFEIPPPNQYTPQIVQMVIHTRGLVRAALQRDAQGGGDARDTGPVSIVIPKGDTF